MREGTWFFNFQKNIFFVQFLTLFLT